MYQFHSHLGRGDVVPLPVDVPTVRAAGLAEHSPQGGRGQLLGDLPHAALRVVREQHQVLLTVDVERSQEAEGVVWVVLPLEDSTEVLDLGGDGVVLVDGVVDFVLGAGAGLDGCVVLFITIKTEQSAVIVRETNWTGSSLVLRVADISS